MNEIHIPRIAIEVRKGEAKDGKYILARKTWDSAVLKTVLNGTRIVVKSPFHNEFDWMQSGEVYGDMCTVKFI